MEGKKKKKRERHGTPDLSKARLFCFLLDEKLANSMHLLVAQGNGQNIMKMQIAYSIIKGTNNVMTQRLPIGVLPLAYVAQPEWETVRARQLLREQLFCFLS